jgi:hypothetical protein
MSINPEIAGRIQGGRFVWRQVVTLLAEKLGTRARATRLAEALPFDDPLF